jgi:hypothetical protein
VLRFTLEGVRAVSVRFWPVRDESLCCVRTPAKFGLGVTAIMVEPTILPWVAEMFVVPCRKVEARPLEWIVAIVVSDELQVTRLVRFCVELFLRVPVAVSCWV